MPVANALADRGHKITMLTNHPPHSKHPNIKEIHHGMDDFNEDGMNMFATRKDPSKMGSLFTIALPSMAKKLYKIPEVKALYDNRKEFDLIAMNHMFNEIAYPFLVDMPFIFIQTGGIDYRQSAAMGNVLNPAYAASMTSDVRPPLSIKQRFSNIMGMISWAVFWRHWAVVPSVEDQLRPQFPDMPPLLSLEKNASLSLMNNHFSIDQALPLLPSQIEVGAMHCKPAKPLHEELLSFIEGAGSSGVIYFSLGSVAQGRTMPQEYLDIFVNAFKKINRRVIWKYEEDLPGLSDNVYRSKWLPQQDILAHPNVRVFISHGGGLSTQEAMYHSTPVLAIPIFGDQPKNGARIRNAGMGLDLKWEELTEDLLIQSLEEIISNPKYQNSVTKVSAALKDQPQSPTERAVFWTEYVIRHNGAPQLKSPAVELSWINYLMLDVLLCIQIGLYVLYKLTRFMLKVILNILFSNNDKKKVE